jgi:hypothetical protein
VFSLVLNLPNVEACTFDLLLEGTAAVAGCDTDKQPGIPDAVAVHINSEVDPDTEAELVNALPSSPWHFYGPDGRIILVNEMMAIFRPRITEMSKRVVLLGPRTGGGEAPLARQVVDGLGSFPADGWMVFCDCPWTAAPASPCRPTPCAEGAEFARWPRVR